jgi:hypothetical protein
MRLALCGSNKPSVLAHDPWNVCQTDEAEQFELTGPDPASYGQGQMTWRIAIARPRGHQLPRGGHSNLGTPVETSIADLVIELTGSRSKIARRPVARRGPSAALSRHYRGSKNP